MIRLRSQGLLTSHPMQKKRHNRSTSALQALINQRADLWRGIHAGKNQPLRIQRSFYPSLDTVLPKNGWPLDHLCELYFSHHGIGELQLLMPALDHLQSLNPHLSLAMINPPHLPYAPAYAMPHLFHIETQDNIWALEESLRSGACYAVIIWLKKSLTQMQIKRIQLAIKLSGTWCVLMHQTTRPPSQSPAALRIFIEPHQTQEPYQQSIKLHMLKKPLGWAGQECILQLSSHMVPAPHLAGTDNSAFEQSISPYQADHGNH